MHIFEGYPNFRRTPVLAVEIHLFTPVGADDQEMPFQPSRPGKRHEFTVGYYKTYILHCAIKIYSEYTWWIHVIMTLTSHKVRGCWPSDTYTCMVIIFPHKRKLSRVPPTFCLPSLLHEQIFFGVYLDLKIFLKLYHSSSSCTCKERCGCR